MEERPPGSGRRRRWVAVGTVAAGNCGCGLLAVAGAGVPGPNGGVVRPTGGARIDLVVRAEMGHSGHLAGVGPGGRPGPHCLHASGLGSLVGGRELPDSGGAATGDGAADLRRTGEGGGRRVGPRRPGAHRARRIPVDWGTRRRPLVEPSPVTPAGPGRCRALSLTCPWACVRVTSPGVRPGRAHFRHLQNGALALCMWKIRHQRLWTCARSLLENGIVIAKSQCGWSRGNPRSPVSSALNGQCLFFCQYSVDGEGKPSKSALRFRSGLRV